MTAHGTQIAENLQKFREDLNAEQARHGRSPESVTVVAVSKTKPPDVIMAAAAAGQVEFGENRVQEAQSKIPLVSAAQALRWHFIGHLQSNKAADAVALFDLIQSVDRHRLAQALNREAAKRGVRRDVLIQVNTTAESQKSGCDPEAVQELVGEVAACSRLRVMGLMTIGPFVDDRASIARAFRTLQRAFEECAGLDLRGGRMEHCSMGMTGDWPIALAEGANMLRIGRAIFGERG